MRVGTSLISNPTLLVTSNNRVGINHPLPSATFHVISSTDPMMIGTVLQGAAAFVGYF